MKPLNMRPQVIHQRMVVCLYMHFDVRQATPETISLSVLPLGSTTSATEVSQDGGVLVVRACSASQIDGVTALLEIVSGPLVPQKPKTR